MNVPLMVIRVLVLGGILGALIAPVFSPSAENEPGEQSQGVERGREI